MSLAKAMVEIHADLGKFDREAKAGIVGTLESVSSRAVATIGTVTKRIMQIGAAAAASMGGMGLAYAAQNEQAALSFTQLLGSAQAAGAYMKELEAFAARTPFEFSDVRDAAARFLAVGRSASEVIPILTNIGNATSAMGTGAMGIERATRALIQMSQKGRVTGEEMLQLAESGIPAWQTLAAVLGVSIPEAMELTRKGGVSVDQMFKALSTGAGETLQNLSGMMEKQALTLTGLVSTFKDTFKMGLGQMMAPAIKIIKDMLPQVTDALQQTMNQVGPMIGTMFGSIAKTLPPLLGLLTPVTTAMAQLASVALDLLTPVIRALTPAVAVMADMFRQAAPTLSALAGPIGQVASVLADGLMAVLVSLGPVFRDVMAALLPLVDELIQAFGPVLKSIAPIIAEVGRVVGEGLVVAFQTLSPVLVSLAPLLAQLAQIVGDAVTGALRILMPIIADVAALFGQVMVNGLRVLLPVLESLAPILPVIVAGFIGLRVIREVSALVAAGLGPWGALVGVVGLVATALGVFGDRNREVDQLASALMGTVDQTVESFDKATIAALSTAEAVRRFGEAALSEVAKKMRETVVSNNDLVKGVVNLGLSIDDVVDAADGDVAAMQRMIDARRRAVESGQVVIRGNNGQALSTAAARVELEKWIQTGEMSAETGVKLGGTWDDNSSQIFAVMGALFKLTGSYDQFVERQKNLALAGDVEAAMWVKTSGAMAAMTAAQQAQIQASLEQAAAGEQVVETWSPEKADAYTRSIEARAAAEKKAADASRSGVPVIQEVNRVLANTIDIEGKVAKVFGDAAAQADAFADAMDRLMGPALGLQEASDNLIAGQDALAARVAEVRAQLGLAADATLDWNTMVDANTEMGRENREMLRTQAEKASDMAAAMLKSGKSVDDATTAMNFQRAALINQAMQFGATREQAEDYVNQLGFTPEAITTAVNLAGVEEARGRAQSWLNQLGLIPESERTWIQARIDEGDLAAAERRLAVLARSRNAVVRVRVQGGNEYIKYSGGDNIATAEGGVFSKPAVRLVAEYPNAHADPEIITPQSMMRNTLLEALRSAFAGGVAVTGGTNGDTTMVRIDHAEFHRDTDLDSLVGAVNSGYRTLVGAR